MKHVLFLEHFKYRVIFTIKPIHMHINGLQILRGSQICQFFDDTPTQSRGNACFTIFLVPICRKYESNRNNYVEMYQVIPHWIGNFTRIPNLSKFLQSVNAF